jgi:hypothetical protein
MTESDNETLHTTTGSSARCGTTTSNSTGPSPTGANAIHGASLDNQLHRTDSLACSHTGPLRASLDNRLPRTHCLQPRQISTPLWTTGCPGHITCSLAGSLRLSRQQAAQDTSPAASPDLCTTPDNQLPRMDSLACSSTGPLCASLPTDYPGTQMPVAGRQRHIVPDHLARRRTGST